MPYCIAECRSVTISEFAIPLSISEITSEVYSVGFFDGRYVLGIPAWKEVSNHFRKPLEKSLRDFKDPIISERSEKIICTILYCKLYPLNSSSLILPCM